MLYEPGLWDDVKRNREKALDEAFKPIAASIDETVTAMASCGKLET
jgi:hypothetical protein